MAKTSWKEEYYVKIYRLASDGMTDAKIAKVMGVSETLLTKWYRCKLALQQAVKEARYNLENRGEGYKTFRSFVYGKLSKRAQELWDKLEEIERLGDNPERGRMHRTILRKIQEASVYIRQTLFIHSLLASNFMTSMACRRLGMHHSTVREWELRSPAFAELLAGIHEHKKDFFESALINLIRQGDSAATIYANKTINRDRGYNERVDVVHTHNVNGKFAITAEDLDETTLAGLLAAQRKKKVAQLEYKDDIQDAEWEKQNE